MNDVTADAITGDGLSEQELRRHLRHGGLDLRVYRSISSTNTVLKQLAEDGAGEGLVLLAEEQTAGRGRMGRSFYSPSRSGLYMSILLRPGQSAAQALPLTACAAVAVAEAVEELTGIPAGIKWVNDVYAGERKICGILTEGSMDAGTGALRYAVVGIGVNLFSPDGGFPEELKSIAGALYAEAPAQDLRCRLAASVLDRLLDYYALFPETPFYRGYRERSFLLGRQVSILSPGQAPVPADVLDVAPDFSLVVRLGDGSVRSLSSGEVSIRPQP